MYKKAQYRYGKEDIKIKLKRMQDTYTLKQKLDKDS